MDAEGSKKEDWRERLDLAGSIRPDTMEPSRVLRRSLRSFVSSTMTGPELRFHCRAISSRTFSAVPSSRHPEPQCLPMKAASACKADEPSVKLCFLVNVRKAKGLREAGGSKTGSMEGIEGLKSGCAIGLPGLKGCAGVPNAGEDDGRALSAILAVVAMTCVEEVDIRVLTTVGGRDIERGDATERRVKCLHNHFSRERVH